MIDLLTLLTLSASSASSAVPAAVRLARINELRNRLDLVNVPTPPARPMTDYERFFLPMRTWPQWAKWAEVLASRFGAMSGGIDNPRLLLPGMGDVNRLFPYRDTLVRWLKLLLDSSNSIGDFNPFDFHLEAVPRLFNDNVIRLLSLREGTWTSPSRSFAENFWKVFSKESEPGSIPPCFPSVDAKVERATLVISPSFHFDEQAFIRSVPSSGQMMDDLFSSMSGEFDKGRSELIARGYAQWRLPAKPRHGISTSSPAMALRYEESVKDGPPMVVLMASRRWDGETYDGDRFVIVHPEIDVLLEESTRVLIVRSGLLGRPGHSTTSADPRSALMLFVASAKRLHLPPEQIRSAAALFPFIQRAQEAFSLLGAQLEAVKSWTTSAIPSIMDWVDAESISPAALARLSPGEAWGRARTWHRNLSLTVGFRLPPLSSGPVLVRWADGATLQVLDTRIAMRDEGTSMGHCIGGPIDRATGRASGSSSYIQSARDGNSAAWSYRDAAGLPMATLEVAPARSKVGLHRPCAIVQVQGPQDGPVEVVEQRRLLKLLTMDHGAPIEFDLSQQASGRLLEGGRLPVDWNKLPFSLRSEYDGWFERFRLVESTSIPPGFEPPPGLGVLVEDGVVVVSGCLRALGVDVNTRDTAQGEEIDTELAIYTRGSNLRLIYTPRSQARTNGYGWRVLRSPMMVVPFSGFHPDPLMALVEANVVTLPSENEPPDLPIYIAPVEAWLIKPWSTPAGNVSLDLPDRIR